MTSGMRVPLDPDTVRYLRGLVEQALDGHRDALAELLADLAVRLDCEQAAGYEDEDAAHDAILRGLWSQWAADRVGADLQRACGAVRGGVG